VVGLIEDFTLFYLLSKGNRGDYVSSLLETGIHKAAKGKDAGDHPPITPMKSATELELGTNISSRI